MKAFSFVQVRLSVKHDFFFQMFAQILFILISIQNTTFPSVTLTVLCFNRRLSVTALVLYKTNTVLNNRQGMFVKVIVLLLTKTFRLKEDLRDFKQE